MHIQHRELTQRINTEVSLADFMAFLEAALAQFDFDDDILFETVLEESDGRRREGETRRDQLSLLFTPDLWPALHQVILSNQWIKGMNVKIHWVRRAHGATLNVTWDLDAPGKARAVSEALEESLGALGRESQAAELSSQAEDLERLFGSMLLADNVAGAARDPFLQGDFRSALTAAHRVLVKRLEVLLGAPVRKMGDLEELFNREPPCLLLPELSGPRLQVELSGLARLLTGLELLLQPLLRGRDQVSADPGMVLKKLVLISFLAERLETAVRNPAAVQPSKTGKPRARSSRSPHPATRPRAAKKAADRPATRRTGKIIRRGAEAKPR